MTFYVITFVGQVSADGKPLPHDAVPSFGDQKAVRELPVWDERTVAELQWTYKEYGSLTTTRCWRATLQGQALGAAGRNHHLLALAYRHQR